MAEVAEPQSPRLIAANRQAQELIKIVAELGATLVALDDAIDLHQAHSICPMRECSP